MDNFMTGGLGLLLVFSQGLLSFFSPCVLPLLPVYFAYLAGGSKKKLEDGTVVYNQKQTFLHTLLFVLGISVNYFILGFGFSKLGSFFQTKHSIFLKVCGLIIILFGLFELGLIKIDALQQRKGFENKTLEKKMNPWYAFVMGLAFSFAWTPCIGPILGSVLLLASSAGNEVLGNIYILLYSLGFLIPFLVVGLFTTKLMNLIKKNKKIVIYTEKIGGVILLIWGILMLTGLIDKINFVITEIFN